LCFEDKPTNGIREGRPLAIEMEANFDGMGEGLCLEVAFAELVCKIFAMDIHGSGIHLDGIKALGLKRMKNAEQATISEHKCL